MTDPDYRMEYTVTHEAYYAKILDREPSINISKTAKAGGCYWEFGIVDHSARLSRTLPGQTYLRVEIFSDAYAAFADVPDFFTALADEAPANLGEVKAILDQLGFIDATQRTDPADQNPAAIADRLRSTYNPDVLAAVARRLADTATA